MAAPGRERPEHKLEIAEFVVDLFRFVLVGAPDLADGHDPMAPKDVEVLTMDELALVKIRGVGMSR